MPLRVLNFLLCQHVWLIACPDTSKHPGANRRKIPWTALGLALTVLWKQLGWGNVTLLHKLRKVWKPGQGTNCWFLQQHGWILNTFCLVKEARPKGHVLYYGNEKEMSYLPEVVKAEIAFKRASQWNFWGYENVLLNTVVVDNDSIHLSNHTE